MRTITVHCPHCEADKALSLQRITWEDGNDPMWHTHVKAFVTTCPVCNTETCWNVITEEVCDQTPFASDAIDVSITCSVGATDHADDEVRNREYRYSRCVFNSDNCAGPSQIYDANVGWYAACDGKCKGFEVDTTDSPDITIKHIPSR